MKIIKYKLFLTLLTLLSTLAILASLAVSAQSPEYLQKDAPTINTVQNSLWWDEAVYMGLAENLYYNGTYAFNTGDLEKFRPPLYPVTLAALFLLTGPSETASIYLNIILAIMTAIILYLLSEELYHDRKISLAATALLLTSQQYIFWTSKILTETLAVFLVTLSLFAYIKISKSKTQSIPHVFGFILALAFLARYPLILLPVYFYLFSIATKRFTAPVNKRSASQITTHITATVIFLITLSPWMYHSIATYQNPIGAALENIRQVNDLYPPDPKTYYIFNFFTYYPFLGPLMIAGIALSFRKKSDKRKEDAFLIGWLAIVLLYLTFGIGQKYIRFLLIALPCMAMLSARALSHLSEKMTKRHQAMLMSAILLIVCIISSTDGITTAVADKKNNIALREAGEYIRTHSSGNETIMSENYPLFHYYTKHKVIKYPEKPEKIVKLIKAYNISYIVLDNFIEYPKYAYALFDSDPSFAKEFEKKEGDHFIKLYRYIGEK